MSKIAFIFPGQGAQVIGMGKEFFDKNEGGLLFEHIRLINQMLFSCIGSLTYPFLDCDEFH